MKCRRHKILDNPETFEYVKDKFLNHQWSPGEIQGRLKLEHASMQISYVTIYRAIYSGVFNEPGLSHGNRGAVRIIPGKEARTKIQMAFSENTFRKEKI